MNLIQILRRQSSLKLGISYTDNSFRYALVCKDKNEKNKLISSGGKIPLLVRLLIPATACTDLGNTVVSVSRFQIAEQDIDNWIESNSQKSTIPGFTPDQIVTEYHVNKNEIISYTIAQKDLILFIESNPSKIALKSLSPPLWDLADLYSKHIRIPFILWKIGKNGSVAGFINDSIVYNLCNYWIKIDDLRKNTAAVIEDAGNLFKSLCSQKTNIPVVIYSPEKDFTKPKIKQIGGYKIIPPPDITGVKIQDHEVYAAACHKESTNNFLPFTCEQKSKRSQILWEKTLFLSRTAVTAILIAAIFLLGAFITELVIENRTNHSLSFVKKQIGLLKSQSDARDSLFNKCKEKAAYLEQESILTNLISAFQEVFPEGMKAEEISVSEIGRKKWKVNIRALTVSSSLIGSFLSNLNNINGVNNVQMLYSEQAQISKQKNGIRLKVECIWE